jgi:hypothetical protein
MKRALTLHQHKTHWQDLAGKTIKNSAVVIRDYGDIHPFKNGPEFHARIAYVIDCDKNFVYHWIKRSVFPRLKILCLLSHPCKPEVLRRDFLHIYLGSDFYQYKYQWSMNHFENISGRKRDDFMQAIAKYTPEPMIE